MPYPAPAPTSLITWIGRGSVFDVALVRHDDQPVICKRLTSRVVNEPAGRAAIVREAKLLALAQHPCIPRLVRVGSDQHGPFLLETRLEGMALRQVMAHWQKRGRLLPSSLLVHVVQTAVETLAELQELAGPQGPVGFVHGDLTPDHVLLGAIGDVGLVDFGACRFAGMDPSLQTQDRGTLPFVAPEVARGESPPTPCSDVYSMAATLYHVAIGQPLTRAQHEAAMLIEIGEIGLDISRLNAIDALTPSQRAGLTQALACDPQKRPQTARALLEMFRESGIP